MIPYVSGDASFDSYVVKFTTVQGRVYQCETIFYESAMERARQEFRKYRKQLGDVVLCGKMRGKKALTVIADLTAEQLLTKKA